MAYISQHRSPEKAAEWAEKAFDAIDSLGSMPARCPWLSWLSWLSSGTETIEWQLRLIAI